MKAGEGLYRSLLVEADFLSNAIYQRLLHLLIGTFLRLGTNTQYYVKTVNSVYSITNGQILLRRPCLFVCLFCRADILSLNLISDRVFSEKFSGSPLSRNLLCSFVKSRGTPGGRQKMKCVFGELLSV